MYLKNIPESSTQSRDESKRKCVVFIRNAESTILRSVFRIEVCALSWNNIFLFKFYITVRARFRRRQTFQYLFKINDEKSEKYREIIVELEFTIVISF